MEGETDDPRRAAIWRADVHRKIDEGSAHSEAELHREGEAVLEEHRRRTGSRRYALFLDPIDFDERWTRLDEWLDHVGRTSRLDERSVRIESGPQAALIEWKERRVVDGVWFEVLWFRGVTGEFHGVNEAFSAAVSLSFEARGHMWVAETSYPSSWFEERGVATKVCDIEGGVDGALGSLFDLARNPFLAPDADQ